MSEEAHERSERRRFAAQPGVEFDEPLLAFDGSMELEDRLAVGSPDAYFEAVKTQLERLRSGGR